MKKIPLHFLLLVFLQSARWILAQENSTALETSYEGDFHSVTSPLMMERPEKESKKPVSNQERRRTEPTITAPERGNDETVVLEEKEQKAQPPEIQKYLQDTIRNNIYTMALIEVAKITDQARGTFELPQKVTQEWSLAQQAALFDVQRSERLLENAKNNQLFFGNNADPATKNLAELALAQARRETAHATLEATKAQENPIAKAALQAAQEAEAKIHADYEEETQRIIGELFFLAQEQWNTFQQAAEQYRRHPDLKNAQATSVATEQARLAAKRVSEILKPFSKNASQAARHAATAAENATRTSGVFGWATKSRRMLLN